MADSVSLARTKVAVRPESDLATTLPKISDLYKWSQEQAAHIRAGRFDLLDTVNVADEVEDVGKREYRSFVSNLENVLTHILKWEQQPNKRSRSWALSIVEHRRRVMFDLDDNPSMAARRDDAVARAYEIAQARASREMKISLSDLPDICPYTWEQIMDAPHDIDRA